MKLYFLDYFEDYTEKELLDVINMLPEKRKKEIYDIYDEDLILRELDEYIMLSSSTMSLIKVLLLMNKKSQQKIIKL